MPLKIAFRDWLYAVLLMSKRFFTADIHVFSISFSRRRAFFPMYVLCPCDMSDLCLDINSIIHYFVTFFQIVILVGETIYQESVDQRVAEPI